MSDFKVERTQQIKPDQSIDYSDIKYQLSRPSRSLTSSLRMGKKELAEQEDLVLQNQAAAAAAQTYQTVINSPDFLNAPISVKENMVKDYTTVTFPQFMEGQQYYANPKLRQYVLDKLSSALNDYLDGEKKAIKSSKDTMGNLWDSAVDSAKNYWLNLQTYMTNKFGRDKLDAYNDAKDKIKKLNKYNDKIDTELKRIQSDKDLDEESRQSQILEYEKLRADNTRNLDTLLLQQNNLEKETLRESLDFMRRDADRRQELKKAQSDRIAQSPFLQDVERANARNALIKQSRGESVGFNILDNEYGAYNFFKTLAEQTPQLAISIAAGTTGGLAGGPVGAAAGLAAAGAALGASDVGGQAFEEIMAISRKDMETLPEYPKVYEQFRKAGLSDQEAFEYAKYSLAINALSDAAPMGAAIEAITNIAGPEASFTKSGLINILVKKGFLKGGIAKKLAGKTALAAADEAVAEGAGQIASNIAVNRATGGDKPITEGAGEAAIMGAELGGLFGGVGSAYRGTMDYLRPDNQQATAQQGQQPNTQPGQQPSGPQAPNAPQGQQPSGPQAPNAPQGQQPSGPQGTPPAQGLSAPQGQQTTTGASQQTATSATQTGYTPAQAQGTPLAEGNVVANDIRNGGYNPQQQQNIANSEAILRLNTVSDEIINNKISGDVNSLTPQQVIMIGDAINDLRLLGDTGDTLAREWINNVAQATNNSLQLDIETLWNRYVTELSNLNNGGVNGTNARTNQGSTFTNSQSAVTRQPTPNGIGQQNAAPASESMPAITSTGTGGATYTDTRETPVALQTTQPETGITGEGANSGRNSTISATDSTQSDLGTGSSAGSPEQRTGNDVGTAGTGSQLQQGSSPSEQSLGVGTHAYNKNMQTGAQLASSAMELNSRFASEDVQRERQISDRYIRKNIIAKPVKVRERMIELKKAMMKAGLDSQTADFCSGLAVRIEQGIARVTGTTLNMEVYPCSETDILRETGYPASDEIPNVTAFTKGNKIFVVDPNNLQDMPHEMMHVLMNHLAKRMGIVLYKATQGDSVAQEFINDYQNMCIALGFIDSVDGYRGIKDGKFVDIFSQEFMRNRDVQEKIAIAMEAYFKDGKFPEASGLEELYRPMAERIKQWFTMLARTLRVYMQRLVQKLTTNNVSEDPNISPETEADLNFLNQYANPRLSVYANGIPEGARSFFDNIVSAYRGDQLEIMNNAEYTAYTQASVDATLMGLELDYMNAGISPEVASQMAQSRVASALAYATATPEQRVAMKIADHNRNMVLSMRNMSAWSMDGVPQEWTDFQNMQAVTGENFGIPEQSWGNHISEEHYDNPLTYALTTLDNDLLEVMVNGSTVRPYLEENVDNALDKPVNATDILTASPTEDLEVKQQFIDELNSIITQGTTDGVTDLVDTAWFDYYAMDGLLVNTNNEPILFYRYGSVLSENPMASEFASQSYGRSRNPLVITVANADTKSISSLGDFENRTDLNKNQKAYYLRVINSISKQINEGLDPKTMWIARRALSNQGYDSLCFVDQDGFKTYVMLDDRNIAEDYNAMWNANDDPIENAERLDDDYFRDVYFSINIKPNTTVEDMLNLNSDLIFQSQQENIEAVNQVAQDRNVEHAEITRTNTTAAQEASRWNNFANGTRRLFVDMNTAVRQFFENSLGAAVGEASSNPTYQAVTNAPNKVKGERVVLQKQILMPLNQWLEQTANGLPNGISKDTFGQDLGSIYRDLHIIESATRQEQELIHDITRASLLVDPNERNRRVTLAQNRLNAYRARQAGSTSHDSFDYNEDGTSTGQPFALYGGMTVDECLMELNTLTSKYDQNIIEEGLGRIRQAIRDVVTENIRLGIYSETDVESFGNYEYYMPLYTTESYETRDPNDVYTCFPSKMNYRRGGSQSQAIDAFSSLQLLCSKSANARGSFSASEELVASYRKLEEQITTNPNIKVATQRVANTDVVYINGMAAVASPNQVFLDTMADSIAFRARVLETNPETGKTQTVPYVILFNNRELETTNGERMKSNKEVLDAMRRMFIVEPNRENDLLHKVGRGFKYTTSLFGSMYTTYTPLFSVTNFQRDFAERTSYAFASTYRDANGNPVDGAKVALEANLNMRYAPEIMLAVFTGKPENIEGKVGQYLQEFERQGILNSASLRAMLKNVGDTNFAYIEAKLSEAKDAKSVLAKMNEIRKELRGKFHTWADMWYAIPTFAFYKAMRDAGLSPDQAAYHVTEMMNLNQRGQFTAWACGVWPYLSSIAQTAAQVTNYFGLNTTTFGHSRSGDKEFWKNRAKAYGLAALTFGVGTLMIESLATIMGTPDDPEKGRRYFGTMSISSFTSLPIVKLLAPDLPEVLDWKLQFGFGPIAWMMQTALATWQTKNGYKKPFSAAFETVDAFYRSMSPIAGPQFSAKDGNEFLQKLALTLSPTIAQPIVEVAVNRNYFGNMINYNAYKDNAARSSDIDIRFTEQSWKDLAKDMYNTFGFDLTPETWKHLTLGYSLGPMRSFVYEAMKDPLLTDDSFKTVRDELGPVWSALGAAGLVGTTQQRIRTQFRNEYEFYQGLIREAGVYEDLKGKGGTDKSHYSKIRDVLSGMGFDNNISFAYAELNKLDSNLSKKSKELRKQLDSARKRNAPSWELERLYSKYNRDTSNMINTVLRQIPTYKGTVERSSLEVPSKERIEMYRRNNANR